MTETELAPPRHRPCGGTAWAQARAAAWRRVRPLPRVDLPLSEAIGCAAAVDLRAVAPMPAVDTAAMDGYAVAGTGPWPIVTSVAAGAGPPMPLAAGSCAQIATGAPVPAGAVGVVAVEDCVVVDRMVDGAVRANRHVRTAGEDAATGDLLVPAGGPMRPATLGLLAAAGYDQVPVRRRPTVQLLLTGDEIRGCGPPADGFVRDAVGPMLPALLRRWYAEVVDVTLVPDTPATALPRALGRSAADAVIVCGATSAGPADRLRHLLTGLGADLVVDGVACRPGHPQLLALLPDGRPLVGLPGNPFAALAAALTLAWPVVAALAGQALPTLPAARLTSRVDPDPGRTRLLPVRWSGPGVTALPPSAPGSLRSAALADAVAVLDPARATTDSVPLLPLT